MIKGEWCENCGNRNRAEIQKTAWGGFTCSRCSFTKFLCERCDVEVGMPLDRFTQTVCSTCITKEKWDAASEEVRQHIFDLVRTDENSWRVFTTADEVALLLEIETYPAVSFIRRFRYALQQNPKFEP